MKCIIYVNKGYIIAVIISLFLVDLIVLFILEPIFKHGLWALVGTDVIFITIAIVYIGRGYPLYFKIEKSKIIFRGNPWKYVITREHLKEIIIEPTGIIFLPKEEYASEFRWIANFPDEPYAGYKVIKFANYRAIGALIEALQPITGTDSFDKIRNPKWRKYLEEKLYGDAE